MKTAAIRPYMPFLSWAVLLLLWGCTPPWNTSIGETGGDDAALAALALEGGGWLVGGFSEADHEESDDARLIRLDDEGAVLWSISFGDDRDDEILALAQASNGRLAAAGAFGKAEPGAEDAGTADAFVAEFNSAGQESWRTVLEGDGADAAVSLAPAADGGWFAAIAAGKQDESEAVLVKLNAQGTEQWRAAGAAQVHAVEAIPLASGGAALFWWSISEIDEESGLPTSSALSMMRYNEAGTESTGFTTSFTPVFIPAQVIAQGDSFVAVGTGNALDEESVIQAVKLDSQGRILWTRELDPGEHDQGMAIAAANDGGYVVAGQAAVPAGLAEFYAAKLNAGGAVEWQAAYGDDDTDIPHAIAAASDGYLIAGASERSDEEGVPHNQMLIVRTAIDGTSAMQVPFPLEPAELPEGEVAIPEGEDQNTEEGEDPV